MLQFQVTGMHCGHCVRAVHGAVRAVAGVQDVTVDLDSGMVRVQGTPDPQAVCAAIAAEDYQAVLIPA
jgi:copper chaperone